MLLAKLNELKNSNNAMKIVTNFALVLSFCFASFAIRAEETAVEVGKHANVNMDAASMLLSLLFVLGLILVSAWLLKKFNMVTKQNAAMKVVASLPLGAKERIMVVQVGEEQLLLGVSGQQVNLLKTLDEPLPTKGLNEVAIPQFLQQLKQKSE